MAFAGHISQYTYRESVALFHTSCIFLESLAHILGRKFLVPFQETCFFFLTAVNATILALSHRNRCVLAWRCLLGRTCRGRSCQLHNRLLCPTINSQRKHESIAVATVHSFIHAHDMYVLAPVNDTQGCCFLLCDSVLPDHSSLGPSLPLLPGHSRFCLCNPAAQAFHRLAPCHDSSFFTIEMSVARLSRIVLIGYCLVLTAVVSCKEHSTIFATCLDSWVFLLYLFDRG